MRNTFAMSESQFQIILQSHLIDPYNYLLGDHLSETLIPGFDEDDPFFMPMPEVIDDISGVITESSCIQTDNGVKTTGNGAAYLPASVCDEDGNETDSIVLYFDSDANAVRALITAGNSGPSFNITGQLTDDRLLDIVKSIAAKLNAFVDENNIDLDDMGYDCAGWNYDNNGKPDFDC